MPSHKIKFFPLYNAYVISPAPKQAETPDFKWQFLPNTDYCIEWDEPIGDVVEVYLAFYRKVKIIDSHQREIPVVAPRNADIDGNKLKWRKNADKSFSFQIEVVKEGAEWGFDFLICEADGVIHCVDPEIRIGSGVG